MYEDLAFAEAAYFFLLVLSYLLIVSGYRRPGLVLALLSLLPPAFVSAKYYMFFVELTYGFFQRNLWAYALLGVFTFFVLIAFFYELDLCKDSEPFCIYMAFGGAALGSVLLLLLAASGGLAIAFSGFHWVITASIYTLAMRAGKSVEQAPLVISRLENACLRGDVPSAIKELRELSVILKRTSRDQHVKEEVGMLLEKLEYFWETGRHREARETLIRIADRVKAWEAVL
jgi:hypothetical protein